MFVSRVQINNFRNFRSLDISTGQSAVIVGENKVGKSNFLHALRLVLDPSLPDSARQLRPEDFWDGLQDPMATRQIIEVVIEFMGFAEDTAILAVLQDSLIQGEPEPVARFTYCFRPRPTLDPEKVPTEEDYEFIVFGGIDERNRITYEERRWLPLEVLPALRDAEADLGSWRRSPLRPLLDRLQLPENDVQEVAKEIDEATGTLLELPQLMDVHTHIKKRLEKMVGALFAVDPSLGFTPTDASRILRSLRLFIDGDRQRALSEASLGISNVLYLTLLALELEAKEEAGERAATILAIEEPEAHLHPHLQRLVFHDFLRRGSPVLLTTHSPHVASIAPLKGLVLLRDGGPSLGSLGTSTAKADFSDQEVADLERYLDATRGEILFARGVILVEGASELFVIPPFAEAMGFPLDRYGVSVCSVHGIDFDPYVKLLGPNGLNIPFTVLTDGDRTYVDGEVHFGGLFRATRIVSNLNAEERKSIQALWDNHQWDLLRDKCRAYGVFVGERTLEADLFDEGYGEAFLEVFTELKAGKAIIERAKVIADQGTPIADGNLEQLLRDMERFGKGRFAQRFAEKLKTEKIPAYMRDAIIYLVNRMRM
jgi:putative ATP-dependent endonuclease of OLD family